MVVARYGDTPLLFRNERGSESSWLRVRAIGTASAIDGRGARVYVQRTASAPEQLALSLVRERSVISHSAQDG